MINKKSYIISIDQGSTSTKVLLVDNEGEILSESNTKFDVFYPNQVFVEFEPVSLWKSVEQGLINVIKESNVGIENIKGLGVTNQRESIIMWNRNTGKPYLNGISWQCKRSVKLCDQLIAEGHNDFVREKTGLPIDSYYSASKIAWVFKNHNILSQNNNNDLCVGNVDSWIIWNLTKGKSFKTDVSNASRTLLMDVKTGKWDEALLKLWDIPANILPEIKMSSGFFGETSKEYFSSPIPITGCIGDAQSALFGQCAFEKYQASNTYGTASNLDINIGNKFFLSKNKIQTTVAWGLDGKLTYALEGGVHTSGSVISWLKENLCIIQNEKEADDIFLTTKNTDGVYFVPALVGTSMPNWDPFARGLIIGLSFKTGKKEVVRAALESIVFQVDDVTKAAEADLGSSLNDIRVCGGVSKSNAILQFQSDISNVKIIRSASIHSTAMGAAFLAGLGSGVWNSFDDLLKVFKIDRQFVPEMDEKERNVFKAMWKKALLRSLLWVEE
jgi:glycerol kinase